MSTSGRYGIRGPLAAATVVLVGAALIGSVGAGAAGSRTCGPAAGTTLATGSGVGIYTVNRLEGPARHPFEVPLVFGCSNPDGHPRLLGSSSSGLAIYRHRRIGLVDTDTLAIHAPWVAYAKVISGVDTWTLNVVTVNLRTNIRGLCPVGGSRAPEHGPSVTRIVLGQDGSVAWAGEAKAGASIIGPTVPRISACDSAGSVILDEGEGIDLESLALHGSTVTWTRSGEQRSAQVP